MKVFPCPKCGTILDQSGELTVDGATVPTFQCDSCKVTVDFLGEPITVALTFAVDAKGKAFDPAADDGRLPLP